MKLLVTGHREEKLVTYDLGWINTHIQTELYKMRDQHGIGMAYSGMASGVDLMFCDACLIAKIPYVACIPFDEQGDAMTEETRRVREHFIQKAVSIKKVKNSWMVEHADAGLVIWDGNKGGTHNVVQQLVEKNKPFVWINPVGLKIWHCT